MLVWQNWNLLSKDADERAIAFERWKRFTAYSAGYSLPGTPDLPRLDERLKDANLTRGAPVFIRIFKREFELELWLHRDGRFQRFATYPICRCSGKLGPKLRTGRPPGTRRNLFSRRRLSSIPRAAGIAPSTSASPTPSIARMDVRAHS